MEWTCLQDPPGLNADPTTYVVSGAGSALREGEFEGVSWFSESILGTHGSLTCCASPQIQCAPTNLLPPCAMHAVPAAAPARAAARGRAVPFRQAGLHGCLHAASAQCTHGAALLGGGGQRCAVLQDPCAPTGGRCRWECGKEWAAGWAGAYCPMTTGGWKLEGSLPALRTWCIM